MRDVGGGLTLRFMFQLYTSGTLIYSQCKSVDFISVNFVLRNYKIVKYRRVYLISYSSHTSFAKLTKI